MGFGGSGGLTTTLMRSKGPDILRSMSIRSMHAAHVHRSRLSCLELDDATTALLVQHTVATFLATHRLTLRERNLRCTACAEVLRSGLAGRRAGWHKGLSVHSGSVFSRLKKSCPSP